MRRLTLAAFALLAAPLAAQQTDWWMSPAPESLQYWREPVSAVSALPTCDTAATNHLRYAVSEDAIYRCTGSAWSLVDQAAANVASTGAGAAAGTGVTAAEYGTPAVHRTVLTLAALSIATTDAGAAGAHGAQKIYDFPAGPIQILGASYNLTTLAGSGGISDTASLVGSLGSATVGTDNATLTLTEADLIASTTGTLTSGAGTLAKHGSLVATAYDGTATAIDAFLNIAVPDAGSSANDTVAVSGTITITWINLGDY